MFLQISEYCTTLETGWSHHFVLHIFLAVLLLPLLYFLVLLMHIYIYFCSQSVYIIYWHRLTVVIVICKSVKHRSRVVLSSVNFVVSCKARFTLARVVARTRFPLSVHTDANVSSRTRASARILARINWTCRHLYCMFFYCFCYLLGSLLHKYIVKIMKKENLRKIYQCAIFR